MLYTTLDFAIVFSFSVYKYGADVTGTMVYACPEWIQLGCYNAEPAAVWSLGCLLYDMVFGDVPFHNEQQTVRAMPYFPDRISPGIYHVLYSFDQLMLLIRISRTRISNCYWQWVVKPKFHLARHVSTGHDSTRSTC